MHSKAFLMRVRNETGSVARMVVRKNFVSNPGTGY